MPSRAPSHPSRISSEIAERPHRRPRVSSSSGVLAWARVCGLAPLATAALLYASSVRAETWDFATPRCEPGASASSKSPEDWLACRAPVVRILEAESPYNRIGSPALSEGSLFGVRASVDPSRPAVFAETRTDQIAGRDVVQLVYRVHFEKIPFRFSRYFFEAHRNPGLLFVLTVDRESGDLLFVSTVHTCGCYYAVVPTDAVADAWLPADWPEIQNLYGQRLPGRLQREALSNGLRITLESQSHRVTSIEPVSKSGEAPDRIVEVEVAPMRNLEQLPISGTSEESGRNGGSSTNVETGSFFYERGPLRGHVRGAWNIMEGLTAFGLLSLDPTVGMDKQFGDPEQTGTPFYTLLPFWLHQSSRLDQMDTLLRTLGFRLPRAEPDPVKAQMRPADPD